MPGQHLRAPVGLTGRHDGARELPLGSRVQDDVEEARTRDVDPGDSGRPAQMGSDHLGDLARRSAGRLRQLQRDARRVVAVLLDLRPLDLDLGGRLDGMINTGSYHVYPREVEEAITAVPGVQGTLVRGDPDPTGGEAVTAYVVPEDPAAGEQLTERIRHALEARLARYKLPKRLHLVGSLNTLPPGPADS